jgi:hypothetical protein
MGVVSVNYDFTYDELTQTALRERLKSNPQGAERVRYVTDVVRNYCFAPGMSAGDRDFLEAIEGAMLLLIEKARAEH